MTGPQFEQVHGRPGWFKAAGAGEQTAMVMNQTRTPNTYFVFGWLRDDAEPALFRIETNNPLEIIHAFEVGARAAETYGVDVRKAVLEQIAVVHAQNPIVPFFADEAGLKCTFEGPLTSEFAEFLNEAIVEGAEAYVDEEEMDIGTAVLRDGFLQLWWD